YTTSSGMIDVMRRDANDWLGLVGTAIGATAILTMLAATSWSLGSDLGALIARRQFLGERIVLKTVITLGVYLFVFSISAFFSFTYYYNNIFRLSSKRIVSELQPMELAADVLLPAQKLVAQADAAQTERLFAAPPMRAHLEAIDAIAQAANGAAGPRLRDNLRKAEEEAERAAVAAARKNAADLQETQTLARQINESQAKVAALGQTIESLDSVIKAKQDEQFAVTAIARQEDQLALDAAKGLDNMGAVCGPNCTSHRTKAAAARRRLEALRETVAGPLAERAVASKQRDDLQAEFVTLRQRLESAQARGVSPPAARNDRPMDIAETLRALGKARDEIRANPSLATLRAAKPACLLLLTAERQSNAAPPLAPADFDCDPEADALRSLFAARDAAILGRAAFEKTCSLDGELRDKLQQISLRLRNAPESEKASAGGGLSEAKKLVDGCVVMAKAAGLPDADVQALLKRSDAFVRAHSVERNRFELAREAFFSLSPDATMAVGVAVAQDAFMFVMKLLSELLKRDVKARRRQPLPTLLDLTDSEADERDTRVLKTLLRGSVPIHGAMSAFDPRVHVAPLPEDVKENLFGLLNRLVRRGLAYVDRRGVYVLDDESLVETEGRLEAALKRQRLRASTADALGRRAELALWEDEGAGRANGPRRGFGGLERYLSPRFLSPSDDPEPAVAATEAGGE
ncbi:MAG TPA: hypothetical protein VK446_16470, partial [Methylocystis sp.]|nr:hypothetical protein [Methylocystis sp.]